MGNDTFMIEFHISPFSMKSGDSPMVFSVFLLIYLIVVLVNIVIILVICLNSQLHTPMYLFLCNLSFIDMFYTTVTVPKLLDMLRSGNNTISYPECLAQVYFFFLAATFEVLLLFAMGYDRYIAICHPLHYNQVLSKTTCILIMTVIWLCACLNPMLFLYSVLQMSFCHSVTIHQFFCEPKALLKISCSGTGVFYMVTYITIVLCVVFPLLSNVISHIKIIRVILHIKSKNGSRKAFSTCFSHPNVMVIYYVNCMAIYLMPPSDQHNVLEQSLTVLFTTVIPIANSLIYSLRNHEIKSSLCKLVSCSSTVQ